MSGSARKKAAYGDLYALPENLTGEIIDGELIVTPRPSIHHLKLWRIHVDVSRIRADMSR